MTAALKLFAPDSPPPEPADCIPGTLTVNQLYDWFDSTFPPGHCRAAEIERQRNRSLFRAAFGDRPCSTLTPREFLAWLDQQQGLKAANTRARWLRAIKRPFADATKLGLISRNPLAAVKLPRGRQGRDWTLAEFRALMRGSPLHFRRLVAFVYYAGPRGAEVVGARWEQVDWTSGLLTQEQHKTADVTGESRVIVLNRVTLRILRLIQASQASRPSQWIFLNSEGNPWIGQSMRKFFRALRSRLKLPKDVKLHGGRHAFGTASILSGNDVATTAVLLGHKSLQTTQRYLHLAAKRDHLRQAAEKLAGGPPHRCPVHGK